MKHETRSAEKLALWWHGFGVVASAWWTIAGVMFIHQFWDLLRVQGFLGAIVQFYIWGAVLSVVCSGCGTIWHVAACVEHRIKLKSFEKKKRKR